MRCSCRPALRLDFCGMEDRRPGSGIATIDLFAGAGGLGLGAQMAGAEVRLSIDNDGPSCATLRANEKLRSGRVLEADVTKLSGRELRDRADISRDEPLLIIGGAPCQPFSKAAYWIDEGAEARYRRARAEGRLVERPAPPTFVRPDSRRTLVEEFWRLVSEAEPDAFVFENVRSITHPRHRPVLNALIQAAEGAGFQTAVLKLNAADFGVPQLRHRVFVVGSRHGMPSEPVPTHADPKKADQLGLKPYETAGPALEPFSGEEFFEPEEVVRGRWAEHLRTVPPGWNYKAHTAWGGHPNPTFVAETRYWNFLLKLSPDRPSWTINANPGPWTGPFHWESRRLRTPELAALQGFPAGYVFEGSRRERVRQIGNAVPPRLASVAIERAIRAGSEDESAMNLIAA